MCFRNVIAEKKAKWKKGSKTLQILLKAATHPTKYGKANSKNAKLKINDNEKKNVKKKKEKFIEIDNQENHSDTSVIEDVSEVNERGVDFKKDKVNLKDNFGKEEENRNKIDKKNQLPTSTKECKGDVKERRVVWNRETWCNYYFATF